MALVGPKVPPANFSGSLYTLRQLLDVPGLGDGVLAVSRSLGESTAILPVPNGHCFRLFISVTSLMDVDSPKGRSLPSLTPSADHSERSGTLPHGLSSVDFHCAALFSSVLVLLTLRLSLS